jgi:hypothetical protein
MAAITANSPSPAAHACLGMALGLAGIRQPPFYYHG